MTANSDNIIFPEELTRPFLFASGNEGNQKISLGGIGDGLHYTLHFGEKSKMVDIHVKDEKTGDYQTLLSISHYACARILIKHSEYTKYGLWRYMLRDRINLGKLGRHECMLQIMQGDDESQSDFIKIERNGKKMRFQKEIPIQSFYNLFIHPQEIYNFNSQWFMVYKVRNNSYRLKGYLYRDTLKPRTRRPYYVSNRNFRLYTYLLHWGLMKIIEKTEFEGKDFVMSKMYEDKNGYMKKIDEILRRDFRRNPQNTQAKN